MRKIFNVISCQVKRRAHKIRVVEVLMLDRCREKGNSSFKINAPAHYKGVSRREYHYFLVFYVLNKGVLIDPADYFSGFDIFLPIAIFRVKREVDELFWGVGCVPLKLKIEALEFLASDVQIGFF